MKGSRRSGADHVNTKNKPGEHFVSKMLQSFSATAGASIQNVNKNKGCFSRWHKVP